MLVFAQVMMSLIMTLVVLYLKVIRLVPITMPNPFSVTSKRRIVKFEPLVSLVNGKLNVLLINETKIDATFPKEQFSIAGYSMPFLLKLCSLKWLLGNPSCYL